MQLIIDLWNTVYDFLLAHFHTILIFVLVLLLGAFVIKTAMSFFRRHINNSRIKGAGGDFLLSVIRVVLYVIYAIALLSLLGVPTTSMVALLSAFALAVSLALQNTFSNVAAGIVIVATKPFAEGDYVDIGGVAGTVETITIFNTKLLTPDNKEIVLPNSTVSDSSITNYSAKETRRLELTFSVSYSVSVEKVKGVIREVLARHEEILKTPEPMVRLLEQGERSLCYAVRVWVLQKDYWNVNFDLKEEIVTAFFENDVGIPHGQLDVHMVSDTPKSN